ncbi:MAG: response regulator [Terriglobia bacterium]
MRILIADDSEALRCALARLLKDRVHCEVCGEAVDGADALEKAKELRPSLILLDISMPGMSGFETARMIREQVPDVKIIIMSQHDAAQMMPGAINAGAQGCVDKSRLSTDLIPAIQAIGMSDV